jgi:hypothetical protein
MIHTDTYGNQLWNKEYPSFSDPAGTTLADGGYKASSFIVLNSGYLIVGERINTTGSTDLYLIETDFTGTVVSEQAVTEAGKSLHGRAVTLDSDGNFIVLASISGDNDHDMYVAKINASALGTETGPVWSRQYGAGTGSVVNRIFMNADQKLAWSQSVSLSNKLAIRFVRASQDAESDAGTFLGEPLFNESASDFNQVPGGYVIVGSTDQSTAGDDDIYVAKLSTSGTAQTSNSFNFDDQNDIGNSVCQGIDGGLLVLATVQSGAHKGNGKEDLLLLKLDGTLQSEWQINYGGLDDEEGASVISTSDNGYLVYGSTSFGNLKKLILMKVNQEGKL